MIGDYIGFKNDDKKKKSNDYETLKTRKPNEKWCADVTIFKTGDVKKQYIHLLIGHFLNIF